MHTLDTFCSSRACKGQHNQHPHCLHTWPEHSLFLCVYLLSGEGVSNKVPASIMTYPLLLGAEQVPKKQRLPHWSHAHTIGRVT